MAASPRAFSLIYGGYTVGDDPSRAMDSEGRTYRIESDEETFAVEFDWVLTAATPAAFVTAMVAAETAFENPNQRLRIIMGGVTQYDFDPANPTNTGFLAKPSWSKVGEPLSDSSISRKYTCRVELEVPYDQAATAGRRRTVVEFGQDFSGRKSYTIRGSYTALGANDAKAQHDANVEAYAATVASALGGVFELVDVEPSGFDDQDKVYEFARAYRECTHNQSLGVLNNADIVNPILKISQLSVGPGDAAGATRMTTYEVTYEAGIRLVSGLTQNLQVIWDTVIFPYLLDEVRRLAIGFSVVEESEPTFHQIESRITARLRFTSASARILERTLTINDEKQSGEVVIPVTSGDALAGVPFQGQLVWMRTITEETLVRGSLAGSPFGSDFPRISDESNAIIKHESSTAKPEQRGGVRGGGVLELVRHTKIVIYQFFRRPGDRGSGNPLGSRFEDVGSGGGRIGFGGVDAIPGGPPVARFVAGGIGGAGPG